MPVSMINDKKSEILVVDDRSENLFAMENILRKLDVTLIMADSGNEALKETLHHDFALILLDVQMPEMTGYEVAMCLRDREETRKIPIIFITAVDRQEKREIEGYDFGAVDYIFKPVNPRIILGKTRVFIELYEYQRKLRESMAQVEERKRELELEIKERLKAERGLLESEERLRTVTDTAKDAIVMVGNHGKILFWNSASEKMFGYSSREIVGKKIHPGLCPDQECLSGGEVVTWLRESKEGPPVVGKMVEMKGIRKNGEEFPVELSLSAIRLKEQWNCVGIIRDITERKKMERFLLLSDKMASIGQLAAGVAHEINNPIGYVGSNIGTLNKYVNTLGNFINLQLQYINMSNKTDLIKQASDKRQELDIDYVIEDCKELVQESLEGIARVRKIVLDLKTFSRVDEEHYEYININEFIESTINIVWNELKYKATLKREYGNIPRTCCSAQELNQVFMNLLVNAAQAIEKQGEIKVKTWRENNFILTAISDNGCGIPQTNLNKIFDPFFTTKDVGKGTGLGLSISYDIVKKHNGEIFVESEKGKGTTFTIKIPVVEKRE